MISNSFASADEKNETDSNEGQYIRLTDTEKLPIVKSNVGYYGSVKISRL